MYRARWSAPLMPQHWAGNGRVARSWDFLEIKAGKTGDR
jgi:hypothetical protein